MRGWLQQIGIHHSLLLPGLLLAGLLSWQLFGRHPWKVSVETFIGMLAESLLFAFALILLGQLNDLCFRQMAAAPVVAALPASSSTHPLLVRAVGFLGAGVYEEFLFRLCLLPACYGLLRVLLVPSRAAVVLSVILTSLAFSVAHYLGPAGEVTSLGGVAESVLRICETCALWQSFVFRTVAGLFFAVLSSPAASASPSAAMRPTTCSWAC